MNTTEVDLKTPTYEDNLRGAEALLAQVREGLTATQVAEVGDAGALQVVDDTCIDGLADQRIVEQGGADADRTGTGNQEFNRIRGAGDAALADDRHLVAFRFLINLMHLEQGDRLDRRA